MGCYGLLHGTSGRSARPDLGHCNVRATRAPHRGKAWGNEPWGERKYLAGDTKRRLLTREV